ncbi:MAG: decaprenyl-phosphate phosphoribosyltransferase [Myxococcota bacterium]
MLGLIKAARPHQWVKNLFVLAPLIFAKGLGDVSMMLRSGVAFFCFSFAASAIYLLNDIADVEADRAHPVKRNRPIASGAVSERSARMAMVVLALTALGVSAALGPWVAAMIGAYLLLNVAYTFRLKRVPYVDVLCIAAGFLLRVLAGTFALQVEPTVYLLIVTFLLSLFLGFGKRMHELQMDSGKSHRAVLESYSKKTLGSLLRLTAIATTGTYVVYTLYPHTREFFGTDYLAASIVFVEFGVLRFMELVQDVEAADSPTEKMLKDVPFLLNLALWAVAVVVILYVT